MNRFFVDGQPLADSSPTDASSPDHYICESSDVSADSTYDCYQSPFPPQIATTRADEAQSDHRASWASPIPAPEVSPPSVSGPKEILHPPTFQSVGCFPDRPEVQTENRSPFHPSGNSENRFGSQSDHSSMPSLHFSSDDGVFVPSYNLLQQPVSTINRTPAAPLHLPTHPDQFASGSTQSIGFYLSRTAISRMVPDREFNLCPGCYGTPFPSMWTMEYLGCVYCEIRIPRAMVMRSELLPAPAPAPAQTPAVPLDRPRSPCLCSRKGKSPQTRGRRSVKTVSPTVQEFRCCPFTGSGNISLPCTHANCSPPPDIGFLSRRFIENAKWERARKDAVASFNYENCGFYKLPIEIVWMIVDLYPRLDYSYMRSIRAEPSIYNHRFEVLRNLIGVSKCFRKTFYNTYWETFEIALTYPRRRVPDPGQLDLGTESARYVSRISELQGLRKTFWNQPATAACIRTLTFRVDRDSDIMQLFVDCLPALPNLHTLEIAPTSLPLVTLFGNAFKHRQQYECIRKLIAPSGAHPILQCLPNLEELVCTRGEKPHIPLTRVFQAYDSARTVASFKCFELIGSNWTDMVGKELLRCFPNIQKLAMRKPSVAHLEKLSSLGRISELELWVLDGTEPALIKRLRAKATEILRKSNPRTVCQCDDAMDVEGVEPVECRCKPPKRVFRLKHLVRKHGQWGTPFWGSEQVEEIEVFPLEG